MAVIEVYLENRADFSELFRLMSKHKTGLKIHIKNHMNYLEPMDILMLTQFAIIQNKRDCDIIIASKPTVDSYLKDIGLIDFIETNTHEPTTIQGIPSYTAMPIRINNECPQSF
jgi:hypothetical protein